jgi:chemotaxis protein MotB
MTTEREEGYGGNVERWLLTYSDMITLLMTFFIVLYAFSKQDEAKYKALAISLHAALSGAPLTRGLPNDTHNALVQTAPSPALTPQVSPQPAGDVLTRMAEEIRQVLQSAHGEATVQLTSAGLDISFRGDPVYFDSASAVLKPAFRDLLSRVAPILKETTTEIRVEGFTNNLPLISSQYPTAWELAAARAVHVVRYLTEYCGLPPHQLEAVSMGQWHPKVLNNSEENLALNRTVDIVVTRDPPVGLDDGGPDIAPPGQGV